MSYKFSKRNATFFLVGGSIILLLKIGYTHRIFISRSRHTQRIWLKNTLNLLNKGVLWAWLYFQKYTFYMFNYPTMPRTCTPRASMWYFSYFGPKFFCASFSSSCFSFDFLDRSKIQKVFLFSIPDKST